MLNDAITCSSCLVVLQYGVLKSVVHTTPSHTEMLITDFILEETSGGAQATEVFSGEVFVEIDAYSHPTTGELEGLIRGTYVSKWWREEGGA